MGLLLSLDYTVSNSLFSSDMANSHNSCKFWVIVGQQISLEMRSGIPSGMKMHI